MTIDRSPKQVYREHPDPWLALAAPTEVSVLDRLEAELLLPLPGRSSLIGVMALGPKLSEEPYSRSDRQLLSSVALQTGLAIENSALVHSLAEESAQRQRIDREIEIARQVQQRLLPQSYPVVKGLDFAGFSRAAREVGGDYYDFIALENGRLGDRDRRRLGQGHFCRVVDGFSPFRSAWAYFQRHARSGPAHRGAQPHHL